MEQVLLADQARGPSPKPATPEPQGTANDGEAAAAAATTTTTSPEASSSTQAETKQEAASPKDPQSLEAELDQVVQSLGTFGTGLTSFWGGLRKQGTSAYNASRKELETRAEAARHGLSPYMDQAKAELSRTREEFTKLGEQLNQPSPHEQHTSEAPAASTSQQQEKEQQREQQDFTPTSSFYGEIMAPGDASGSIGGTNAPAINVDFNPSQLFNRISSQVQSNPSLASLQQNLQKNLTKVAPMASSGSKMAETYFHKGEAYIKHAGKDLEQYLNQAVRIVPGEVSGDSAHASTSAASSSKTGPAPSSAPSSAAQLAGRKEQLLHRLATNQAIFLLDPAQPLPDSTSGSAAHQDTRETFAAFMQDIQAQGGWDSPAWKERIQATLEQPQNAPLKGTMDALVPAQIPADVFWARYFFRVTQIEADDARRKQVLETAAAAAAGEEHNDDDDFNWDNEDEPESAPASAKPTESKSATTGSEATLQPSARRTSSESERGTSTSSYDVVSGPPSDSDTKTAKTPAKDASSASTPTPAAAKAAEEDEDSDWE